MVASHFDSVWRALKRLGVPAADADDGAQRVFVVAARRLGEIESGRERQYLLGIALRIASEVRRSRRRRPEVPLDTVSDGPDWKAAAPDDLVDEKRLRQALARILDDLPVPLREAFVLFELEELAAPQVAELLGIPVGTVASRVRRAREAIRQKLRQRAGSEPTWLAAGEP